ncbi:MAG: hypothetical protein IPL41_09800 [Micropruina sp.]|nr:hypothetical protein [Micropruina sp.]
MTDAQPPDAVAEQEPQTSRRSIPAMLIVLAVVLALSGGVWWAGGFDEAKGRSFRLPVGTVVDLGPMSIAFDRALAREHFGSWTLYVFGRCRNNTGRPLDSAADRLVRNGLGAQHPVSKEIPDQVSLFFGPGDTLGNSGVLNPGTPMVPCQLAITFETFPDTSHVSVGASELEWIDSSPTGEGTMVWSAARVTYRFEVPVVLDRDEG